MSNIFVRSTTGLDTNSGATWALAKATAAGAAAIAVAGDTVYFSSVHSESSATSLTLNFAGTLAAPIKLISVSDAAEPPTAVVKGASIATTGASSFTVNGVLYAEGILFKGGFGTTNSINFVFASQDGNSQLYRDCEFWVGSSNITTLVFGSTGSGVETRVTLESCLAKFAGAGQRIDTRQCKFRWSGGGIVAASVSPTNFIGSSNDQTDIFLENMDLSPLASTFNIFLDGGTGVGSALIRNSKLPAAWTGLLVGSVTSDNVDYAMHNGDSGDTNFRLWEEGYRGSVKSETTIIRTDGDGDGTTRLSWKMAASANTEYPHMVLETPEIVAWNDTVGTPVTATVEVVHDSQGSGTAGRLTDAEAWLEVNYLGTAGFPLGTMIKDAKASVLAVAADQTSSEAAWTTTGLTTPLKQKLSVTFTPQEKGFLHAKVVLAKPSATCYVYPTLTVA